MRIIIANGRYFPSSGPEKYLFMTKAYLEAAGHEVIPFAVRFPATVPDPYERYFVPPATPGGKLYYEEYKNDLTVLAKLQLLARATYSSVAAARMHDLIRETKPDVVYVLNIVNVMSPSIIRAASRSGIPVVQRLSDFSLFCASYAFVRDGQFCQECLRAPWAGVRHRCVRGSLGLSLARTMAMRIHRLLRIYRGVSAYVCPSTFMERVLRKWAAPESVRSIFLRTPAKDRRRRPVPGAGRRHFLFSGRISPEKGVVEAIQAYGESGVDVPLLIAGKGTGAYARAVEEAARRTRGVVLKGFLDQGALQELVATSIATLHPAKWPENGPNSVIESLAMGTPIIGSRVPGIEDYTTEETAILCPMGDTQCLADAMRRMCGGGEIVERMGAAALDYAETELTPERHYKTLLEVFEGVA